MTVTCDGGGRRGVLTAKTDSVDNVNNNNNNNNNDGPTTGSVTGKAAVLSVRRVLFGPPADPAETRAWLDRQLFAAAARDSRAWNFDFVNERPLRDSPADRYAWERVCLPQPTPPAQQDDAATEQQQDGRLTAKQRQSKVTDFMTKTKKRPLSASGSMLAANKVADDESMMMTTANKRSRRTMATMAI